MEYAYRWKLKSSYGTSHDISKWKLVGRCDAFSINHQPLPKPPPYVRAEVRQRSAGVGAGAGKLISLHVNMLNVAVEGWSLVAADYFNGNSRVASSSRCGILYWRPGQLSAWSRRMPTIEINHAKRWWNHAIPQHGAEEGSSGSCWGRAGFIERRFPVWLLMCQVHVVILALMRGNLI